MENTPNIDKFKRKIKNRDLSSSIESIRISIEKITAEFNIIKYFPNHGISHSDRIANYILNLIDLYKGTEKFSEPEYYVLLASACLHDIGMQCDIGKYPWIREKAEELGAWFDIDFKGGNSLERSPQQQEAIRVNHHYLTAAWIDFSRNNIDTSKKTELDEAIKTIPPHFVKDIMDICLYHSTEDFRNCDEHLQLEPGRKRFPAAILRFADELDIDWSRIYGIAYKDFNMPTSNKIYWWLHEHTHVQIDKNLNNYVIKIRLNPNDKEFAQLIKRLYIDKFEEKNRSIIYFLNQNNIPIVPSDKSEVVLNEYDEEMPKEIRQLMIEQCLMDKNPSMLILKPGERVTGYCYEWGCSMPFNYYLLYLDDFNYRRERPNNKRIIYIPYDSYCKAISIKKFDIYEKCVSILYDGLNYKISLIKRIEDIVGPRFMEVGEKIKGIFHPMGQRHQFEPYIISVGNEKIYVNSDIYAEIFKLYINQNKSRRVSISIYRKNENDYEIM